MIQDNSSQYFEWQNSLLRSLNAILNHMPACPNPLPPMSLKFKATVENLHRLFTVRQLLADDSSKTIFDAVVNMYVSLGFLATEEILNLFGLYNTKQWEEYATEAKNLTGCAKNDYILDRVETWVLEGYSYGNKCRVSDGDIVIDAGAFTGNTAFYFQKLAGSQGRVYSFEPGPQTYQYLQENIKDSGLENITAINMALSDKEGFCRFRSTSGAGASIANNGDIEVKVTTIDAFVDSEGIKKIDFIKMDIEGAEIEALQGARNVIQKHHPKMAICVYHANDHLFRVPETIRAINANYNFYMKHNSVDFNETVLFCKPVKTPLQIQPIKTNIFEETGKTFISFYQKLHAVNCQNFFDLVIAYFEANNKAPLEHLNNPKVWHYIFAPFSKSKEDHFEVLIHPNTIFVAIHFEQAAKRYGKARLEAIRALCACLQKQAPQLVIGDSPVRVSCGFELKISEYQPKELARITAASLNFLVNSSLPLLLRESLLSEPLAEFTMNSMRF